MQVLTSQFSDLCWRWKLVQQSYTRADVFVTLGHQSINCHLSCSGHALLVGVGGSGKQSLARLSGFICGYATYTIVISGNYNMNNFREDLQKMYKRAGVKVSSNLLRTFLHTVWYWQACLELWQWLQVA